MTSKKSNRQSLLEKLQKYESFIAWSALSIGLLLFAGFILAFILNARAELDEFVVRTSSARWENNNYSETNSSENRLTFSKSPSGNTIVEKCLLFSGVYLTADSSGTTVLVDDDNRKVDEAVFITDYGDRIVAKCSSDGVDFTLDGKAVDFFYLDGYAFEISQGKVEIDGYELKSFGEIKILETTTTTTAETTTSPETTTATEETTLPQTTTPPSGSDVESSVTPPATTTKKPVVTTVTTTTPKPTETTTTTTVTTTTTTVTTTPLTKPQTTVTIAYNTDDEFIKKVRELVNAERKKAGLGELKGMISLDKAATIRAQEISTDDKNFSHTRPNGKKWFTVLAEVDITPKIAGENIAAGQTTPEMVVSDWMDSEKHKENILNPQFSYMGIGYVKHEGHYYWAQIFTGF